MMVKEKKKSHESPQCSNCVCEYNRLEEARFWTRIMMEHALFIKLGLPANEPKLRAEAEAFKNKFEDLLDRLCCVDKLKGDLLKDLIKAVEAFIEFKAYLLKLLIQCKAEPGSNYPLLLDPGCPAPAAGSMDGPGSYRHGWNLHLGNRWLPLLEKGHSNGGHAVYDLWDYRSADRLGPRLTKYPWNGNPDVYRSNRLWHFLYRRELAYRPSPEGKN